MQGKKTTSWSGVTDVLESNGAVFTGQPVEIDENIITADGPASAKIFAEKIVEFLKNKS